MNETQNTIGNWADKNFNTTIEMQCAKLREEVTEFEAEIEANNLDKAAEELADVVVVAFGLAFLMGFSLLKAVNQKMIINRARKWNKVGKVFRHVD